MKNGKRSYFTMIRRTSDVSCGSCMLSMPQIPHKPLGWSNGSNSVLSMERYNASASQQTRFHRALGIASVAHMYSATNVFAWAIAELLKYLANHRHSQELMTRAYRLAVRVVDNPILLSTVRREWIKGLEDSDPVNMLTAAKSVGDHGLLGCAYFAILQTKTNGWIANEPSLNSLDRARLMVGALNLRHWERSRPIAKASQASTSAIKVSFANSISKVFDLPAMATWDPQKLWDLFTQSAFGLSFEHDADLSAHDARPPHSAQQTA